MPERTPRALNREFEDKLAMTVMRRVFSKLFLPAPVTTAIALYRSVRYIKEGLSALWHGKLTVAVLDATAVTVSMVRGDFATAGSVMFMLRLGEILEEWTHKKSVADLAGAMALNVDKVWLQSGENARRQTVKTSLSSYSRLSARDVCSGRREIARSDVNENDASACTMSARGQV